MVFLPAGRKLVHERLSICSRCRLLRCVKVRRGQGCPECDPARFDILPVKVLFHLL